MYVPCINMCQCQMKISNYKKELEEMKHMDRQGSVSSLIRYLCDLKIDKNSRKYGKVIISLQLIEQKL